MADSLREVAQCPPPGGQKARDAVRVARPVRGRQAYIAATIGLETLASPTVANPSVLPCEHFYGSALPLSDVDEDLEGHGRMPVAKRLAIGANLPP